MECYSHQWILSLMTRAADCAFGNGIWLEGVTRGLSWEVYSCTLLISLSDSWLPFLEHFSSTMLLCHAVSVLKPVNHALKLWAKINPSSCKLWVSDTLFYQRENDWDMASSLSGVVDPSSGSQGPVDAGFWTKCEPKELSYQEREETESHAFVHIG